MKNTDYKGVSLVMVSVAFSIAMDHFINKIKPNFINYDIWIIGSSLLLIIIAYIIYKISKQDKS